MVFVAGLIVGVAAVAGDGGTRATHCVVQPVDFDQDGKVDPAEYTVADGTWHVLLSIYGYTSVSLPYGNATCRPTSGDYDGDGIPEIAAFDTATGIFYTMLSSYGYYEVVLDMGAGTEAILGDYDGDGRDDPTVYDGRTGIWTVRLSTYNYTAVSVLYGNAETEPLAGDFDGDGRSDLAVYRESDGTWWFALSGSGGATAMLAPFGATGWSPVTGDFDGDHKTDFGVYNRTDGTWYVALSAYGYAMIGLYGFGGSGYTPVAADFNGDGYDDPAVYQDASRAITVNYFTGAYATDLEQTNTLATGVLLRGAGRAADGSIGILYCEVGTNIYTDYSNLCYLGFNSGGAQWTNSEVLIDEQTVSSTSKSLVLFDENNSANLFVSYFGFKINRVWISNNTWTNETLISGLTSDSELHGCTDANGAFHVLAYDSGWDSTEVTFVYLSNASGAWTTEVFTYPKTTTMYVTGVDMATASDGSPWVIFGLQDQIRDDVYWQGYLYCSYKANGVWTTELAAYASDSSSDAAYLNPSLVVMPSGQPVIASHLAYNVMTGSDLLSELVVASRSASGWASEILANVADDYFGSDGGNFTGLYPDMVVDENGACHIIFSDLASSHISGYETAEIGQIRYATNRYGYWTLSTLLRQSAASEEGVVSKILLLSPDAQAMDIITTLYPGNVLKQLTNRRRATFAFP